MLHQKPLRRLPPAILFRSSSVMEVLVQPDKSSLISIFVATDTEDKRLAQTTGWSWKNWDLKPGLASFTLNAPTPTQTHRPGPSAAQARDLWLSYQVGGLGMPPSPSSRTSPGLIRHGGDQGALRTPNWESGASARAQSCSSLSDLERDPNPICPFPFRQSSLG